jgi:hypothetical protein
MRMLQVLFWSAFTTGAIALGTHGYAVYTKNQARDSDRDDVKAIAKALTTYREKHGQLPPAVLFDPATDTPYSWRIAILPELGLQALYDVYRRNEPWDSQHNLQVLSRIPDVYRSATAPPDSTMTAYFALTGADTAMGPTDGLAEPQVTDDLSSTVMIVSARREVPWTSPRDIEFDNYAPLPEFGGMHEKVFHAAFADGAARTLANSIDAELLKHMISARDGWPLDCEF